MLNYLILCRSLTFAQRTAAVLERVGIRSYILRTPKNLTPDGCSHSVKIAQKNLPEALRTLEQEKMTPKRIFITAGDGAYQEVEF